MGRGNLADPSEHALQRVRPEGGGSVAFVCWFRGLRMPEDVLEVGTKSFTGIGNL